MEKISYSHSQKNKYNKNLSTLIWFAKCLDPEYFTTGLLYWTSKICIDRCCCWKECSGKELLNHCFLVSTLMVFQNMMCFQQLLQDSINYRALHWLGITSPKTKQQNDFNLQLVLLGCFSHSGTTCQLSTPFSCSRSLAYEWSNRTICNSGSGGVLTALASPSGKCSASKHT